MSRSPGHQKYPDHKVEERPLDRRFQVLVNGTMVAESSNVIEVDEEGHRPRYYIPRNEVRMGMLQSSGKFTECPFKGKAEYFDFHKDGELVPQAAWSYPHPYDEHGALAERIAFHDEKPEVEIRPVD